MNRYLLAGCAAVALTMGCGAANAQAKFEVRIGGDAYFEAGYVDQDNDANLRDTEFRNRFRLNIVPSAKADNGLEYGGRIRIRANNPDRNMDADRALIFVGGSFGRVEMGTNNSLNDNAYVMRPIDFHFLGIWDSAHSWVANSGATPKLSTLSFAQTPLAQSGAAGNGGSDVNTKITYVSPRFSGLQLGASYAPNYTSSTGSIDRTENNSTLQDVYEIGLNYKGEFSGVSVGANAGYIGGSYENSAAVGGTRFEDLSGFSVGAQIGYAGFILGGGYIWYGESGQAKTAAFKDDYEVWNVGLQYTTGPIIVGVGYTYGKDAGSVVVSGDRSQDYFTVGASYTVAPGLRVGLEYNFISLENDASVAASTRDVDSNVFLLRSVLSF